MSVPVDNWYMISQTIDKAGVVVSGPNVQVGMAHIKAHADTAHGLRHRAQPGFAA